MRCSRCNRPAPIVLLKAERHPKVPCLVECHQWYADLACELRENGVHVACPRPRGRRDARHLAIKFRSIQIISGINVVLDVPRIGVSCEFLCAIRPHVARVQVLHESLLHALEAKRQLAPGKMLRHTVEQFPSFRILPWTAHQRKPLTVHKRIECRARRLQEGQLRDVLCSGRICIEPVDEPYSFYDPALDEPALIDLWMELERRDGHMPAHRLPVNDRPTGLAKFFDEAISQCQRVQNKPIRTIASAAITGSGPGIAVLSKVKIEGRAAYVATPWPFAFIAMREHHESAIPLRRHADHVVGALVDTLAHRSLIGRSCG